MESGNRSVRSRTGQEAEGGEKGPVNLGGKGFCNFRKGALEGETLCNRVESRG